jgi:hypothetical protein
MDTQLVCGTENPIVCAQQSGQSTALIYSSQSLFELSPGEFVYRKRLSFPSLLAIPRISSF